MKKSSSKDSSVKVKKRTKVMLNPDTRRIYVALIIDGQFYEQDMSLKQARELHSQLTAALEALEN